MTVKRRQVEPAFFSERQLAQYLNVTVETLRRWRKMGIAPAHAFFGARVRYSRDEIVRWIASNTKPPIVLEKSHE